MAGEVLVGGVPADRGRPRAGGAVASPGRRSGRGCWRTRSPPTCASVGRAPVTTRCGARSTPSVSTEAVARPPRRPRHRARRGRRRAVRRPARARRARPRRARRAPRRAARRAQRPPRRGDRAGAPRHGRPPRPHQPGGRRRAPPRRPRGRRPGRPAHPRRALPDGTPARGARHRPAASPAAARPRAVPPSARAGPGGTRRRRRTRTSAPRWGLRTATLLGALSTASGLALTATAGWLITRASEHPPVLHLMVAIVGVRLFGLARPVLRHAERVLSHDVVLRELAERRAQVFADLVPLVPGRLGPRRGDLLTRVVDDVDALLDERLRVRQPVAVALLVGARRGGPHRAVTPGRRTGRARGVAHRCRSVPPRPPWCGPCGGGRRRAPRRPRHPRRGGRPRAARARAVGRDRPRARRRPRRVGRAAAGRTPLGAGRGRRHRAHHGDRGPGRRRRRRGGAGRRASPAMLALLLLVPLALADVTGGPRRRRSALGARRAPPDDASTPCAPRPRGPRAAVPGRRCPPATGSPSTTRVLGWDARPALDLTGLVVRPGEHLGVTGPSGSGKSTLAATLVRFIDPVSGRALLDGTDLRDLALDDVRTRGRPRRRRPARLRLQRRGERPPGSAGRRRRRRARRPGPRLPRRVGRRAARRHPHPRRQRRRARCPAASAPGWRWRGRCWPTRRCWCSTSRRPTSTAPTARAVAAEMLGSAARAGRSIVWITHGTVGLEAMDRVVELGADPAPSLSPSRPVRSAAAG